ncbi:MAG: HigA family addiction module antidote protein [Myxococcales bacterium]|nr:HigA family addiction module antidote protein [Myxococcales bacterium]
MKIIRRPTAPGEILQEEFLSPLGLTQKEFADHVGVDLKVINRLINGRTRLGASLAIRIAEAHRTTPDFWLNAQKAVDLHEEYSRTSTLPDPIPGTGT